MTTLPPNTDELAIPGDNLPEDQSEEFNRIIGVLEFEIARIRVEESQPGWTTWALLGGLATTWWFLTVEIESHGADLRVIAYLFLVYYLALASIRILHNLVSGRSFNLGTALRFRFSHSRFSKTRSSLLIEICQSVVLIYIVTKYKSAVHSVFSIAAYLFLGIDLLAGMLVFALSVINIPFTDPHASMKRRLMPAAYLFCGVGVIALVGFADALFNRTISPLMSEYRITGLLIAITQILIIFGKREQDTPLLQSLIDIRRNLGLGRLQLDDAKHQIEIALEGMTASDVLQDELAMLLSHIEGINIRLESAAKEIQALTTTLPKGSDGLSEDQRTLLMAVRQSVDAHLQHVNEIQASLSERIKRLQRRVGLIVGMSPESKYEITPAAASINAALQSIEIRKRQLGEQVNALDERLRSDNSDLQS
ncbi:MAG: hypothetical protein QOH49_3337 [Acidobacteriota bacterium]|jgi:hypothetical protein|nr:hypothetical protein [Acidobacteriota bacterium]